MKRCLSCLKPFDSAVWACPHCGQAPAQRGELQAFAPALAEHGADPNNKGFENKLFGQLAALEAKHFWYRVRNRLIIWAMRQYFPHLAVSRQASFLEIGCGTGYVLSGVRQAIPQLACAGSEIFVEGLQFAAERLPGVSLYQMDARVLPFENEFDVIGTFDVLEHIEEDEKVLSELYRAVKKPGGGIIITVPQHPSLWSTYDERAHHVRRYTSKELAAKIQKAGFKLRRMTSFVSTLLPAMWLSRRLQKNERAGAELDQSHEFAIHPLLNKAFEQCLNLEAAVIAAGVNFPIGGSLLAIAEV